MSSKQEDPVTQPLGAAANSQEVNQVQPYDTILVVDQIRPKANEIDDLGKRLKRALRQSGPDAKELEVDGLVNAFERHILLGKLIWLLILLFAIGGTSFLVTNTLQQYYEYRVLSTIRYSNEFIASIRELNDDISSLRWTWWTR